MKIRRDWSTLYKKIDQEMNCADYIIAWSRYFYWLSFNITSKRNFTKEKKICLQLRRAWAGSVKQAEITSSVIKNTQTTFVIKLLYHYAIIINYFVLLCVHLWIYLSCAFHVVCLDLHLCHCTSTYFIDYCAV